MAILTTETLVDKVLYNRVQATKDAVNNRLIDYLVERGIKKENITISTEDVNTSACCKQLKIIAYGTPSRTSSSTKS